MSDEHETEEQRVVRFRQRTSSNPPGHTPPEPDLGLKKFENDDDPDDYQNRMLVNIAALCFLAVFIGAGLWIANTMATVRKTQDCALSGRRNCAPIDVPINNR